MVVGIVTTLNFIVFFTPGQLSPFSIHIIKWQLSANSINILMEENLALFGNASQLRVDDVLVYIN